MNHRDAADTGREWNPYEVVTPPPSRVVESLTGLGTGPGASAYDAVEPQLAGRISRLIAKLIDTALWLIPIGLVGLAGYKVFRQYQMNGTVVSTTGATTAILLACVLVIGLAVWNLIWLHQSGQTVGKRVVGIRTVRSDGSQASLARLVLLRGGVPTLISMVLGAVYSPLGTLFAIVDALFIFGEERRCLHDQIADTIVVTAD